MTKMGSLGRSGMTLIITFFVGVVIGFFIGVSFPTIMSTKFNIPSTFFSSNDLSYKIEDRNSTSSTPTFWYHSWYSVMAQNKNVTREFRRSNDSSKWLRILLSPISKLKAGDNQQSYAIEHPEPLLHFALCSGSHSDPAIRMYTPKRVFQELEVAKEEYIRASLGVRKEQKILLPKIVESFVKDSGLCFASVVEMVQQSIRRKIKKEH